MAVLERDHQFELAGCVFGYDRPVEIEPDGFGISGPVRRTSDAELPTEDGSRPGVDRKGIDTWKFSLYTNCETEEEAYAALADLTAAWDAAAGLPAGEMVPLRYRIAGEILVVYGRPRRFTPVVDNRSLSGMIPVQCDFDVMHPLVFDDELHSVTVPIAPPIDVYAGLLIPFVPPVTLSAGASEKIGVATVGGVMKTPVTVEITGPIEGGASVQIADWLVQLTDPVMKDNPVTVDGRPWVRAATYKSGGGARVAPRVTRLSRMWLEPGNHPIIFRGVDQTVTASVKVSWRNARRSIR